MIEKKKEWIEVKIVQYSAVVCRNILRRLAPDAKHFSLHTDREQAVEFELGAKKGDQGQGPCSLEPVILMMSFVY